MREYLSAVAGNAALRQRLGAELVAGSLSHAYVIEGPAGSGKTTLALELATALACENRTSAAHPLPCRSCSACRKILAGNSPDVIHVYREEDKAQMGVNTVRFLKNDVTAVPNDLAFKVYLIHDAHTMTTQAQNAFLLTLEEPPPFVLFFLLAEDASALLETIRSRAPILRMQPIADGEIKRYLLSPACDGKLRSAAEELQRNAPGELDAILRMSGGYIGGVIPLLDEGNRTPLLKDRARIIEICEMLASGTKADELMAALLAFGSKRGAVTDRLQLLKLALRDLFTLCYADKAPLLFFTDDTAAAELSESFTARRLLSAIQATESALDALNANANVRLTLFDLLGRLLAK